MNPGKKETFKPLLVSPPTTHPLQRRPLPPFVPIENLKKNFLAVVHLLAEMHTPQFTFPLTS